MSDKTTKKAVVSRKARKENLESNLLGLKPKAGSSFKIFFASFARDAFRILILSFEF